ncbi:glycoside hydrolase family 3 N-terminal domain-containing protein [Pseudochryseolinea flava]|uniref:Beta-glucosidase n=1 Tax=Pseudochryseolinea flava TaxID=2059302 RepID=A0A364XX32_9BACT|nr:glycoside hydrolase family 3 N-terminal domain-containing protein [Pseudochryseolinea flava]RAV97969.1 beta-glucosidase [Pseudochryseolinea flava]
MRYLYTSLCFFILIGCAKKESDSPAYKNAELSVEERVSDLLGRMTRQEKIAQMYCVWNDKAKFLLDSTGHFDIEKAKKNFPNGLGQVGRPSDTNGGLTPYDNALLTNAIQKYFIEETRLGIPVFYHEEALHGHAAKGATSFPQPIGLAATFNPDLIEQIFAVVGKEARLRGTHQVLAPVVDVARDPRWGRVEETYGEDPYLVGEMGVAAVKGFQGDGTFKSGDKVVSTLKHMAGHGWPEAGSNIAPANVSERVLREVFFYPFAQVVKRAQPGSLMASYNEVDGVPSHGNKWMLRDVLRGEMGFKGYVVSDYYAVRELNDREGLFGNHVAATHNDAAKLTIEAGVNIELPEIDCFRDLDSLVGAGFIQESLIDELVGKMLEYKFRMGLFDNPYVDAEKAKAYVGNAEQRVLARQSAREVITLLKNENNIAPLDLSKIKSIAVVGPNANRVLLGGYSGEPVFFTTVVDGIKEKAGDKIKVTYSEGCKITTTSGWSNDKVEAPTPEDDRKQIKEALAVARTSDVIVLAIGQNEQVSREAWAANHMGDRTDLDLIGRQNELIDAMVSTGKPVIAFVFNGSPLSFNNLINKVPVVFECWYLGQEMGGGVADVLFGEYNPGGKLPITIPRSVGHVPAYYNHKPAARRGYLFDDVSPLFAFGYGLSYTTFELSVPRLSSGSIKMGESLKVAVDVKNTGARKGDEVVQLYIRDKVSSVTRPVKELKDFKRISLAPGETKTVELEITPEKLSFYDINMKYVVEPGEFEVMVGTSSRDQDLKKVVFTVTQ